MLAVALGLWGWVWRWRHGGGVAGYGGSVGPCGARLLMIRFVRFHW